VVGNLAHLRAYSKTSRKIIFAVVRLEATALGVGDELGNDDFLQPFASDPSVGGWVVGGLP